MITFLKFRITPNIIQFPKALPFELCVRRKYMTREAIALIMNSKDSNYYWSCFPAHLPEKDGTVGMMHDGGHSWFMLYDQACRTCYGMLERVPLDLRVGTTGSGYIDDLGYNKIFDMKSRTDRPHIAMDWVLLDAHDDKPGPPDSKLRSGPPDSKLSVNPCHPATKRYQDLFSLPDVTLDPLTYRRTAGSKA
jgi:hypothetical protein